MAFYRENKSISFNLVAETICSHGALLLLQKLKRKHELISCINNIIPC